MLIKSKIILICLIIVIIHSDGDIESTKYELDSSPKDLIWCGNNNEYALILTETSSVYRSDDKGMHWKKLNDIFINTGKDELEENENEIGKVSQILQSPADKNLLIFLGTHGINWIGEDCGRSIKALNQGRRINEFYFHPTERNWGLASAYSLCEDFVGEPCRIFKEVYVTLDMGENWKQIGSYVVQFGWGIVNKQQIEQGVPKQRVIMTYDPRGKGDQKTSGWSYKVDCVYSDDFFATSKVLVSKGNKFLLTKDYLFVAQVVDQETQEVLLLGSKSTMKNYALLPVEISRNSVLEHSYTFLDTTLDSVFLHINHFGDASPYGDVYASGEKGVKYSISLRNNVRTKDSQCDFEKIYSVEGAYIGNVISYKYIKTVQKEIEGLLYDTTQSMGTDTTKRGQKGAPAAKGKQNVMNYKDYMKTLITSNKGGNWRRIKAPLRDSEGKKYECGENCFINLFGLSSEYPPYYSVESAAGIIIGNGNIGRYLTRDVATFMSRDGGFTWFEIEKGSHIYEIGNHGGLILLAKDQEPTNKIKYSWNEGLTWEDYTISEDKFNIKNIIIEPSSRSHFFLIYGEKVKNGAKKGIVIGLNFGEVFPPCRKPNYPDSEDSDYETWRPRAGEQNECFLGHKVSIIRRKRDAKCINNELLEQKIISNNCDCTEDDYQCDIGYARNEPGAPCIKEVSNNNLKEDITKPPLICESVYYISKGYRRIPGDTCVNGVKYDPIALPCPYAGKFGSFGLFFFILLVIVFGFLIYLTTNCNFGFDISKFISFGVDKFKPVGKGSYQNVNIGGADEDNVLFEEENKGLNSSEKTY